MNFLSAASLLVIVLVLPMLSPAVNAQTVSVPNPFSNGTSVDAGQVNANFDAVESVVNSHDTRITGAQSVADAAAAGHTVNIDTQLTSAQVAAAATAEGFVTGAHTTDTNIQLDEAAGG